MATSTLGLDRDPTNVLLGIFFSPHSPPPHNEASQVSEWPLSVRALSFGFDDNIYNLPISFKVIAFTPWSLLYYWIIIPPAGPRWLQRFPAKFKIVSSWVSRNCKTQPNSFTWDFGSRRKASLISTTHHRPPSLRNNWLGLINEPAMGYGCLFPRRCVLPLNSLVITINNNLPGKLL